MNIYRCNHFQHSIQDKLPPLKAILKELSGGNIRRADRFTQLALIGAFKCVGDIELPSKTGLFISSSSSSQENSFGVLNELFRLEQNPSPFKFVNTVGNAANFHISQKLNLSSSSIYLAQSYFSLESTLKLAKMDIEAGRLDSALIGLISEAGSPLNTFRSIKEISDDSPLCESSIWFLVGQSLELSPLISNINFINSAPLNILLDYIEQEVKKGRLIKRLIFSHHATEKDKKNISHALKMEYSNEWPKENIYCEHSSALYLSTILNEEEKAFENSAIIDTNKQGLWSAIIL